MTPCPGCGAPLTGGRFLCNACSDASPDDLVVDMAEAHDAGDAAALSVAAERIREQLTD